MKGVELARKLKEGVPVAYFHEQPGESWTGKINWNGPGFYEVKADNDDDHTNANFGNKVSFVLDTPNAEGEPPDPENNKGHWVYSGEEGDS
jgi:hypothetical protein